MADYCAYPLPDDPPEKKKEYINKLVNPLNAFRQWNMYRMATNTWFYRGAQDIKAPDRLMASGSGFRFERDRSFHGRFTPDNIIATNVNNEIARHLGKKYQPDPNAEKNEPDLVAAAKLGRDIIEHTAKKEKWNSVQYALAFDFATAGTMIAKTYLEENHLELSPLASDGAAMCAQCGAKYANGEGMEACEHCGGELEPYEMSMEDIGQPDALGNPMGEFAPSTKVCWEAVNWSQFYPENSGFGVEPHTMKVWAQKTPRSLDYIRAYYPEFQNLKAEDVQTLMRESPILGYNLVVQGGAGSSFSDGIYENYANLVECHIDSMPYPGLELGHSMYMCGDEIVSRPLCVEVETPPGVDGQPQEPRKVKKVTYSAARRCREPGIFWGRTPVDDQVPLQRKLNRLDFQVEQIRERGGPMAGLPTDVEIHDRGFAGVLRVFEIESGNPSWNLKDAIVNGQPLTGNAYMEERQALVNSLQRLGAPDVELGKNPTGVNTIGQLQILAEQAEQQRGPSLDEFKGLLEAQWSAYLELCWAFQREETKLEVEGVPGSYEQKAWIGKDLLGQTRVSVSAKGGVDKQVLRLEVAKQAWDMGLYSNALTTQPAIEEMLEILNAPRIEATKSMQVERANQAWIEFKADGTVPVFDESTHSPLIWFQTLGKAWLSDEGLTIQREVGWDTVIRGIAGWRPIFDQQETTYQQQASIYGGIPPEQWPAIYQQGTATVQQAMEATQTATAAQVPVQPPSMTSFPLYPIGGPPGPDGLPMPGVMPPNSLDHRILTLWQQMLGDQFPTAQTMAMLVDRPKELQQAAQRERTLRMYAVLMQTKVLSDQLAMMPAPGAPGAVDAMARGAA